MKKWLIIPVLIIILIIWQTLDLFFDIRADKRINQQEFARLAIQETGFTLEEVTRYHGQQLYYVFSAHDQEANHWYVFVSEGQEVLQLATDSIKVDKEEVAQLALEQFNELVEVIRVLPGVEGNQYVWEVTALDQQDRLQYIYYSMLDGLFRKRYTLDTVNPL